MGWDREQPLQSVLSLIHETSPLSKQTSPQKIQLSEKEHRDIKVSVFQEPSEIMRPENSRLVLKATPSRPAWQRLSLESLSHPFLCLLPSEHFPDKQRTEK